MDRYLKWKQRRVILFSVVSLLALSIPVMEGYSDGKMVSASLVIRGFNFVEFSPLGSIVLLAPLLLIGLQVSVLDSKTKTILLFIIVLVNAISINHAAICANQWLMESSTRPLRVGYGLPIYLSTLVFAQIELFLICQTNEARKRQMYESWNTTEE